MMNHNLTLWVNQYTNDLYKWAFHKTSSAEMAEDMVQETFLAAAQKIGSFKGDSSPKTWLFAILNHKIIDFYRKNVNKPISVESNTLSTFFDADGSWKQDKRPGEWEEDEPQLLDDQDFQKVLQKCLDALPEQWNMCVKLKYLSGKKGEEICQELGIATTNYWQIVHRAKVQLRNCVEKNWFEEQ